MHNIQQMIERHGGLEAVRSSYLRIMNPPYMRLVIEVVSGPLANGSYEVSVAHYSEQNGDAMRDPEITFLVNPPESSDAAWLWTPLTFTNDYLGSYQVASDYEERGILRERDASLIRELQQFASTWDINLKHQGFLEAFGRQYKQAVSASDATEA